LKKVPERNNAKFSPLIPPSDSIRTEILKGLKYVICTAAIVSSVVAVFYYATALQLLFMLWLGVTLSILGRLLPSPFPMPNLSSWGLGVYRKAKRIAVSIGLV
jgi:hypothetical protein